jgi:osmotically-inducible protein OsmY
MDQDKILLSSIFSRGITMGSETTSDLKIVHQTTGQFTQDQRINIAQSDLAVGCTEGQVTLRGTVPSVAAKRLAARLAAAVPGVKGVDDQLRVASPMPMGDQQIANHIRRSFVQERNFENEAIDIEVRNGGEVVLRGTVHALVYRRLAEVLCWWIPGVTSVDNQLDLDPFEQDSDEELKDNLLVILEKDMLVDPSRFQLEVSGGIVTLRGAVPSAVTREAAEKDCWYTPGVVDVVNELAVLS